MMTREQKLHSMRMQELIIEAERLGVKIDKKGAKGKAVDKILAFEAEQAQAAAEAAEAEVAEAEVAEAEVAEEQVADETTCSDGTPFVEVMEEITAGAEKRAKEASTRKPRKKKEQSADVSALLAFILDTWQSTGGIVKMPAQEGALFRPLCADNGRQVVKLMWTTKKVSFFVRVEGATKYAEQFQKINYAMPFQCMFFHDTEEVRQGIRQIFQMVLASDSIRQKKQSKKEAE